MNDKPSPEDLKKFADTLAARPKVIQVETFTRGSFWQNATITLSAEAWTRAEVEDEVDIHDPYQLAQWAMGEWHARQGGVEIVWDDPHDFSSNGNDDDVDVLDDDCVFVEPEKKR